MVNPGAFRGSQREFLMTKKPEYSRAVTGNYVADAVAKIQRQYLKRYPINLPHNEEPNEAFLQAVNDDAPDPEPEEPNPEAMTESEYRGAVEKVKARKALLEYRKKQIKRWLAYQYIKDNDKLTGKDCVRPRLKTPTNVWRKTQRDLIEEHLKVEIELEHRLGKTIPATQYASIRDKIARELFAELDEGTRRAWREKAAAEHKIALEKYKEEINDDPSREPADLQMAIQGMVQFMQPILDMVSDVTGWKVSLLAGGPEPAQGGRLSVISIHSGYTSGDIKMTYGRAERARYKKHVIPSFGAFLKLCYSPEECRARALPDDDGYMPMSAYENDTDETTYHAVESDTPTDDKASASEEETNKSLTNDKAPVPIAPTPTSSHAPMDRAPVPTALTSSTPASSRVPDDRASPIHNLSQAPNDQAPVPVQHTTTPAPTSSEVRKAPMPVERISTPMPTTLAPTSSEVSKAPVPVEHTSTPMPTSVTYATQDHMPSDANPFPFEDDDDEDDFEDILPSPLPSAPPSPASSHRASPMPVSSESQHVGNVAIAGMTDPVANPAPVTKVISKPSGPTSAAAPNPLSSLNGTSKANGNEKGKKRRNIPDPTATPASGAEPPSKRPRTKTLHAIESEEQSAGRKKRDSGKKAGGARARGKENLTADSGVKSSGKGKRV